MSQRTALPLVWAIGIGLGLTVAVPALTAQAQARSPQEHFFLEFVGGSIGGAVGVKVVEDILSSSCRATEDPELCRRAGRVILRPVGYPLAVFAGTAAGIATTGVLSGVRGNITATLIGSFAGAVAGLVEAAGLWTIVIQPLFEPGRAEELVSPPETPEYLKRTIPLIVEFLRPYQDFLKDIVYISLPVINAAYWGTVGFNSGAQARAP